MKVPWAIVDREETNLSGKLTWLEIPLKTCFVIVKKERFQAFNGHVTKSARTCGFAPQSVFVG